MPALPAAPPPAAAVHHAPPAAKPAAQVTYTVQPGDSLWSIARHFYGTGFKWADIFHANSSQISDPHVINMGQQLAIPHAGAGSTAAAAAPAAATAAPQQVTSSTSSGKFVNPIGAGLSPGRVDTGADYGGTSPLYAIGDGTITSIYNSAWPGVAFIGLHLDDGRYAYYAEDISPSVQVGDRVSAGQPCTPAPRSSWRGGRDEAIPPAVPPGADQAGNGLLR
ncbi:MAG TPA: LysM peptidoglycan-binding domain-containing protein [Streptosporangiaceae bacterium]|nr:LysM peptidoglycan-binding domain-containing protein [Streptosporangiaceae bacterium]